MPVAPYLISGVVYDSDGSTALQNAIVTAYNVTKGEWLPDGAKSTTNASGEYSIDLANMTTDYEDGDLIQILAFYHRGGSTSNDIIKSINARHTVDTSAGALDKDLYLHIGEPITTTVRVTAVGGTRSTTTGKYIELYDRENDALIDRIEIPQNESHSRYYGLPGKLFKGGVCVIYETDTSPQNDFAVVSINDGRA